MDEWNEIVVTKAYSERNIFVAGNVNVETAMKVKLESDDHCLFFP